MLKLSKKGKDLITCYKKMAKEGYDRTDGIRVQTAYNDFELKKFRNVVKQNMCFVLQFWRKGKSLMPETNSCT